MKWNLLLVPALYLFSQTLWAIEPPQPVWDPKVEDTLEVKCTGDLQIAGRVDIVSSSNRGVNAIRDLRGELTLQGIDKSTQQKRFFKLDARKITLIDNSDLYSQPWGTVWEFKSGAFPELFLSLSRSTSRVWFDLRRNGHRVPHNLNCEFKTIPALAELECVELDEAEEPVPDGRKVTIPKARWSPITVWVQNKLPKEGLYKRHVGRIFRLDDSENTLNYEAPLFRLAVDLESNVENMPPGREWHLATLRTSRSDLGLARVPLACATERVPR
jgi:hypothetical protein